MVTFFVVNQQLKEKFEKEFHVPYGYYTLPHFQTEDGAIGFVENMPIKSRNNLVVERCENGEVTVVFEGRWYDSDLDKTQESYN